MKDNGRFIFGIIVLACLIIVSVVLLVKYNKYKEYQIALRRVQTEQGLGLFYLERLRFPIDAADYRAFLSELGENEYRENLNLLSPFIKYDPIKACVTLYSGGFDGDDDGLGKTYNPYKLRFVRSLFVDGDVIIQRAEVADILYVLQNQYIALQDGRPDSTLKDIRKRLVQFTMCYIDTIVSEKKPPQGRNFDDEVAWIETRKVNGMTSVKLYGRMDQSIMRRAQIGLQKEIDRRRILSDVDNAAFGFSVKFFNELTPIWCD